MEAEVIDKIVHLAGTKVRQIDGLNYADERLWPVEPPVLTGVKVISLDALTQLLTTGFESAQPDTHVIQVASHNEVHVYPRESTAYGQRPHTIEATLLRGDRQFGMNDFLTQEDFIIGMRSCFVSGTEYKGDLDYVLGLVATLGTKDSLTVEDNGITQTVTAASGAVLVVPKTVKQRVMLRPYRTFREVEQPESEFILRVRKGSDGMPKVALIEADGGAWKLQAMENVKAYLKSQLDGWTVIA